MILKGKTVNFLGDSITEGTGVGDREKNRYDNILKRECGLLATYNYGIAGSRLAHQKKASLNPRMDLCFCGRAFNMNKEADIIVVYGGVNDYLHGDAPIGSYGDKTPATFCGAVDFLMEYLTNEYPSKPIVFMTPARLMYNGNDGSKPSNLPTKDAGVALPIRKYIEIIENTAKQYGVHVLNLFDKLGLDPTDEEIKKRYTKDGLHFNDDGHYFLAKALREFLESL